MIINGIKDALYIILHCMYIWSLDSGYLMYNTLIFFFCTLCQQIPSGCDIILANFHCRVRWKRAHLGNVFDENHSLLNEVTLFNLVFLSKTRARGHTHKYNWPTV